MIDDRVLNVLEYNKILDFCAENAVLESSKQFIRGLKPVTDVDEAEFLLKKTTDAYKLLYAYGVSGIPFFDDLNDELERSSRGATLSFAELLRVARLLTSSRIVYDSVASVSDEQITALRAIAESVYFDKYLENEIKEKILSEDTISDNASEKLAAIRKKIKRLNEQIRERLSFLVRSQGKFLQDAIITMRGDRYVVPVKSEYKGQLKGLIHDQSASGSTLFVEPVEVLEMNNDLKTAAIEEKLEIERILSELTQKVGLIADRLKNNIDCLIELDSAYAKATYAYKIHAKAPKLNSNGYINIIGGRHPLIDEKKVVPITLSLGAKYNYLLITGPNTGGKTVTMKLAGLFSLMAASGFYLPSLDECNISIFDKIFCDIGDEQSIEQSLSTFSSHMKNVIDVANRVDEKSLVLIDEIGAGTDPEEGSALARAILERLLERGSFGIITTHYSALKEFAYSDTRIMNASMDFDEQTFAPLYKLSVGIAGSSNAIKIATRLGLSEELVATAKNYLSENKISFENVIAEAQSARKQAQEKIDEYEAINKEKRLELDELLAERAKFEKEREKFFLNAKIESRRIINESLEEADEYIKQIKEIFDKDEISGGDIIRARTLRNKLEEQKYKLEDENEVNLSDKPIDGAKIKVGDRVFVNSMKANGVVVVVNRKKQTCEVNVGEIRALLNFSDLYEPHKEKKEKSKAAVSVRIDRANFSAAEIQINVIGKNTEEALAETENFIDRAIVNNLTEIKIIHGVGLKILSKAIHEFLRKNPHVAEYRFGKYGEGEHGVTFVTLK